jgi:hypothetical protein
VVAPYVTDLIANVYPLWSLATRDCSSELTTRVEPIPLAIEYVSSIGVGGSKGLIDFEHEAPSLGPASTVDAVDCRDAVIADEPETRSAAATFHIWEVPVCTKYALPAVSEYAAPYSPEGRELPPNTFVTVLLVTTPVLELTLANDITLRLDPFIPYARNVPSPF